MLLAKHSSSCPIPSDRLSASELCRDWHLNLLEWQEEDSAFQVVRLARSNSGAFIWSGEREKLARLVYNLKPLIFKNGVTGGKGFDARVEQLKYFV